MLPRQRRYLQRRRQDRQRQGTAHGNFVMILIDANVAGSSMKPLLPPGSKVRIALCSSGDIRAGDVAVLRCRGLLLMHRVIAKASYKGKKLLRVKSDTSFRCEPWAHPNQIIGKVVAVSRGSGFVRVDGPVRRIGGLICSFLLPPAAYPFSLCRNFFANAIPRKA